MEDREHDQFAKFFGVLGAIVGFCYGATVSDGNGAVALVAAAICGVLGLAVGSVVYRVVIIGLIVLGFLIRQEIFRGIGSMFE